MIVFSIRCAGRAPVVKKGDTWKKENLRADGATGECQTHDDLHRPSPRERNW